MRKCAPRPYAAGPPRGRLGGVEDPIVEVALAGRPPLAEWLLEALESASGRVILLDATAGLPEDCRLDDAVLRRLALLPPPVVFVFEGALDRLATALALASDIRICGEAASMAGPLAADARLRTLARGLVADDLARSGTAVDAGRLFEAGLVTGLTASGDALPEARRVAALVASRGPIATRLGKEAIWRGLPQPLEQALRFETDLTLLLQTTKDRAEGVRAFVEKRPPHFTGD